MSYHYRIFFILDRRKYRYFSIYCEIIGFRIQIITYIKNINILTFDTVHKSSNIILFLKHIFIVLLQSLICVEYITHNAILLTCQIEKKWKKLFYF